MRHTQQRQSSEAVSMTESNVQHANAACQVPRLVSGSCHGDPEREKIPIQCWTG